MAVYRVKRFANAPGEILKKPLGQASKGPSTPAAPKPPKAPSPIALQNVALRLLSNAISLSNTVLRLQSNQLRALSNAIRLSLIELGKKLASLKGLMDAKRVQALTNHPKRIIGPFRKITLPVPPKSID